MDRTVDGKKIISTLLLALLVVAYIGVGVLVCLKLIGKKNDSPRAEIDTDKPRYESVLTRTREDFSSEKEYALYLYETACRAFQDCEKAAIIDDYASTTDVGDLFSISCRGCRFTVKNGTEYYYADYSGTEEGLDSMMKLAGKEEDTLFAIRSYTDISKMDYLYSEKVLRPIVQTNNEGEFIVTADWSENNGVSGYPKHETVPVYCSEQEGVFEQTEQCISSETVTFASVSYNEEKEYYTVEFVLDVNNPKTTAKTIDNLRAGLKGGEYTSIKKTYQIWNNGFFRYCDSMDIASNGAFELSLSFISYFRYKEEDCNPLNYEYLEEVKQKALEDMKK